MLHPGHTRRLHAWPFAAAVMLGAVSCATLEDGASAAGGWWTTTSGAVTDFLTDDEYRSAVHASVQSWFSDFSAAIATGSVEQLASRAEEARRVAAWGHQYEALAPYASWLEARMDYFEAAQAAMAAVPDAAGRVQAPRPPPRPLPPPPAPRPPRRPDTRQPTQRPAPVLPPPRPRSWWTPPPPATPAVATRRAAAVASSDYWRRAVGRHRLPPGSRELVPDLQRIFRAEGVPDCLIWAAEVESTMNPEARSPAGAVGLFQLMPATARSLGLKTAPQDERLDSRRNAAAAARYYRQLYRRFQSWPLVFAAYNCGEGRVAGALRRRRGRSFEEIAPHLPLETQMYVPRVQETIRLRSGVAPELIPAV